MRSCRTELQAQGQPDAKVPMRLGPSFSGQPLLSALLFPLTYLAVLFVRGSSISPSHICLGTCRPSLPSGLLDPIHPSGCGPFSNPPQFLGSQWPVALSSPSPAAHLTSLPFLAAFLVVLRDTVAQEEEDQSALEPDRPGFKFCPGIF